MSVRVLTLLPSQRLDHFCRKALLNSFCFEALLPTYCCNCASTNSNNVTLVTMSVCLKCRVKTESSLGGQWQNAVSVFQLVLSINRCSIVLSCQVVLHKQLHKAAFSLCQNKTWLSDVAVKSENKFSSFRINFLIHETSAFPSTCQEQPHGKA